MSELVEINKSTALAAYSSENGLSAEVDQVRAVVDGFKHDLTNATNRAKTASLAAKVAKVKVKYDDLGKDLVSEWKAKSKLVDASRKSMRDDLDAIKIEARRPLTEWEAEQSRLEEVKREEEAAKQLQIEKESDHEMAVLMDDAFDREKAEAAAKVEADRIAHEESIKQAAIAESERKAEEERRAAIAREENLKLEAQQAEASRVAMAEQAEKNAKLAEEARVKAEALA
ncbi:MAG: cell envelope biogenesis protein TolA, partial [Gammaproteobacteria bacterium]|nr:cell envelope biogenesis protein TolA [Gammaproteobacteria bacterium]